jgi:hypothetical protein
MQPTPVRVGGPLAVASPQTPPPRADEAPRRWLPVPYERDDAA